MTYDNIVLKKYLELLINKDKLATKIKNTSRRQKGKCLRFSTTTIIKSTNANSYSKTKCLGKYDWLSVNQHHYE